MFLFCLIFTICDARWKLNLRRFGICLLHFMTLINYLAAEVRRRRSFIFGSTDRLAVNSTTVTVATSASPVMHALGGGLFSSSGNAWY